MHHVANSRHNWMMTVPYRILSTHTIADLLLHLRRKSNSSQHIYQLSKLNEDVRLLLEENL